MDRIKWNNQPYPPNQSGSRAKAFGGRGVKFSLKLHKKLSGPSKLKNDRLEDKRCLWKRPEAKFCYCLLQMELFEKFKYHTINKESII